MTMSSMQWPRTARQSLAQPFTPGVTGDSVPSIVVRTSVVASITAPSELIHESLSWLDRKYASTGYARWLSRISAAASCQRWNRAGSSWTMPAAAYVSSSVTPEGGAPALASRVTTATSRRWKAPYRLNKNVTTSASTPRPVAAETSDSSLATVVIPT